MTTTEQQLAAALRLVMASPDCNCGFQGCGSESQCARDRYNSAQGAAREALATYDAQQALPPEVVFAWGPRSALSAGLPIVTMRQRGPDDFSVQYGMQLSRRLTYAKACAELGQCIMHALACDSLIDNRTKAEACADGDV
jgi:hypothetical protein